MKTKNNIKKELPKKVLNQLAKYRKEVEDFNAEIEAYAKMTGDYDVPEIDSTVIGYDKLIPYTITERANGFRVTTDGNTYTVKAVCINGEWETVGWHNYLDGLKEQIKYDRRRLNKGIRVWKSENPDAELERDDEDEE